ncbi:MAG: hypothetical protein MZV70_15210 [Desulfobacterales bacterium]|nr:hypothetical protein [Desulfobacterales bacterium]
MTGLRWFHRAGRRTGRAGGMVCESLLAGCVSLPTSLLVGSLASRTGSRPAAQVTLSSAEVETGGTLIVPDRLPPPARRRPRAGRCPSAIRRFTLFPHPGQAKGVYAGLVGIPLAVRPGPAALTVEPGAMAPRRLPKRSSLRHPARHLRRGDPDGRSPPCPAEPAGPRAHPPRAGGV